MQSRVTSDTRPSRFSACNIEKRGMDLGTRLLYEVVQAKFRASLEQLWAVQIGLVKSLDM